MDRPVRIESKMNGMVLTLSEGEFNTRQGDLIVSKYYHGMKQQWCLKRFAEQFVIQSGLNLEIVLDVEGANSAIYSTILCFKYHGKENQLWRLKNYQNPKKPNEKDAYYIQNVNSGYVLEIEGGINCEGMTIVQNKQINGNLNQLWVFKDVEKEQTFTI